MKSRIVVRALAASVVFFVLLAFVIHRFVGSVIGPPTVSLLAPGVKAPLIALPDHTSRRHSLVDYANRPIILAFFNSASPAYLPSLRSLRDTMPEFDKTGAKVFAITDRPSSETHRTHDAENLNYPILTDTDAAAATQYGAIDANHHIKDCVAVVDETSRIVIMVPVQEAHSSQLGWQLMNMAACCLNPASTPPITRVGHSVEDAMLPNAVSGRSTSVLGTNRPPYTVIEFLSSKCPCSLGYDGRMTKLNAEFAAKGVAFIGINSSVDESSEEEAAHVQHSGIPFPVLMDNGNVVANNFKASITPEIFVVDRHGVIRYHGRVDDSRDPAAVSSEDLRIALRELLAGKSPGKPECQAIGCAIMRLVKKKSN